MTKGRKWLPSGEISWTDVAISLFAMFSTVAAWFTYAATREYTRITANVFETGYRPYISLKPGDHTPPLEPDAVQHRICWSVVVTNEGSVPAYHVQIRDVIYAEGNVITPDRPALEAYLAPHQARSLTFCTPKLARYTEIVSAMRDRTAEFSLRNVVLFTYEGVSKKKYQYCSRAKYYNERQQFVSIYDGEDEASCSAPQ